MQMYYCVARASRADQIAPGLQRFGTKVTIVIVLYMGIVGHVAQVVVGVVVDGLYDVSVQENGLCRGLGIGLFWKWYS